ncbi:MAG: hypothetical protein WCK35_16680 [Chloroflexota bacterium]
MKRAGLKNEPNLHDFRRAFAHQRVMGHADLNLLRHYLAQTHVNIEEAHMLGPPVDKSL